MNGFLDMCVCIFKFKFIISLISALKFNTSTHATPNTTKNEKLYSSIYSTNTIKEEEEKRRKWNYVFIELIDYKSGIKSLEKNFYFFYFF